MPSKDSATKFILRHVFIGVGIGALIAAIGGYAILIVSGEDPFGVSPHVFWTVAWLVAAGIGVALWFGGLLIFGAGRRLGKPWAGRPPRGLPAALRRLAESTLDP